MTGARRLRQPAATGALLMAAIWPWPCAAAESGGSAGVAVVAAPSPAAVPSDGDPAEAAGLRLADDTPTASARDARPRAWQLSLEPAAMRASARAGGSSAQERLAMDLSLQRALAGGWRVAGADRLDLYGPDRWPGQRRTVNTWKELYASGPVGAGIEIDAGRVNARFGVAYGYNPTDYFRLDAVRDVTSPDPASLRENRLGTAMLRAQRLWDGAALTAIVAPKLAAAPDDAGLSADLGATNRRTRWLLAWSQRWTPILAPQWLLMDDGEGHGSPRLGLDATALAGNACVAHLEASGGRTPSLLARAEGRADAGLGWHGQAAAGMTCSDAWNQSLTLEFEHNGEGLAAAPWRTARLHDPALASAVLQAAQARQDPPTRENLFTQLRWQNAGVAQLDVSGFVLWNLADRSRLAWAEARFHRGRDDLALQWQLDAGGAASEHGLAPQARVVQVSLRHWF